MATTPTITQSQVPTVVVLETPNTTTNMIMYCHRLTCYNHIPVLPPGSSSVADADGRSAVSSGASAWMSTPTGKINVPE